MSTSKVAAGFSVVRARETLDESGYVVIPDMAGVVSAEEYLWELGELIPQYTGSLRHEVTYRPGNDGRSYSQSTNAILAHTEAPGWEPSPAYLALYCHRQARCGGGHTDLLDLRDVRGLLEPSEQALLTDRVVTFPGPGGGVRTTMISTDPAGRTVLRFSHNLLTTGSYDPDLGADVDADSLPLGEAGRRLAHRVGELFQRLRTRVLIPDDALLIWDNQRMVHARAEYADRARHLTRFWIGRRTSDRSAA